MDKSISTENSPGTERTQNNRIWFAAAVLIFALAILARTIPGPRTIDDSYITYRYARNILAGNGFVYNPGEHVLGTTTPLYTILLVILAKFSGGTRAPFTLISLLVNALADSLTCLLLLRMGSRLGKPFAGISAALLWAIAPFSVTFAIGGLETSLYALLLTATMSSYLERHYVLAWLAGASALLTRPDALILLGPLALDRLATAILDIRRQRAGSTIHSLIKETITFLLPVSAWVIFAFSYFGSPLPHSIAAKTLAYRLPPSAAFVRLLQHYATPFLEHLTFGVPWIGIGLVLYVFLSFIGARAAIRSSSRIWPWAAYPWLYFVTFAIANPLIFRWYLTPPLPAYFLIILVGAEQILMQIARTLIQKFKIEHKPPGVLINGVAVTLIIIAPAGLSLRDWRLHPDHGPDRPAPEMAYIKLELLYHQAAGLLVDEIQSQANPPVLAAGDVGELGFLTGARILDTVGLNSPVSTRYYPLDPKLYTINYAIPPDLIFDEMPEYIVILEVYGREGLLKDPRLQDAYQLRQVIDADIYGSQGMLIFQRLGNP